ncbi:MAG: hypothetical protein E7D48_00300 [Bifidobacterium scardovii]|uniref:hypothetical protein n=1 Tax=Bifidobacterium scardovii TaxID=158787 RepID=UPI0029018507|nr:hypothetical protein [Bifidobacterium scardovii]MDU2420557.1 hypothetical protein [Bifidobacterium scardovii]
MKKIITAVAVALGTCGLALAAPTSAMAAEVGVEIEHQTTVEGTLPNSDVLQHLHDTNNQIKQDIDTTAQHLDQAHNNLKADHDALKQQHESLVEAQNQAHKNFQQALANASKHNQSDDQKGTTATDGKSTDNKTSDGKQGSATSGSTTTGKTTTGKTTTASTNASGTQSANDGASGTNASSTGDGTATGAASQSNQGGLLASTGIGMPALALSITAILALALLSYSVKAYLKDRQTK